MTRPIERYVRASVDIASHRPGVFASPIGSVEAGLWYEQGEPTAPLRSKLREVIEVAVRDADLEGEGPEFLSRDIEQRIIGLWGRPFFVEVWNEHEALTQVYAPCGMPRES